MSNGNDGVLVLFMRNQHPVAGRRQRVHDAGQTWGPIRVSTRRCLRLAQPYLSAPGSSPEGEDRTFANAPPILCFEAAESFGSASTADAQLEVPRPSTPGTHARPAHVRPNAAGSTLENECQGLCISHASPLSWFSDGLETVDPRQAERRIL